MKYLLFIFFTASTLVNATPRFLAPRQEGCPPGFKVCGINCIPNSYSCCRDSGGGGCPPGSRCGVGSNGVGGCCPVGEICTGEAPLPSGLEESEFTAAADPTTTIDEPTIDEPTTTINDSPPNKTTEPGTSGNNPPVDTKEDKEPDNDNAGASNRLDSTVSYLLVGAMALLI
uniref:WGS project CBMI000000000 data, contig CS3069_c001821 n=1 Tax=Fusarium clavum TaxID=2594811 RepID=A0A090MG90_9HYPO|nr:unnamed protein product [Fusarium clavum]